jgi:hypothetical protein
MCQELGGRKEDHLVGNVDRNAGGRHDWGAFTRRKADDAVPGSGLRATGVLIGLTVQQRCKCNVWSHMLQNLF